MWKISRSAVFLLSILCSSIGFISNATAQSTTSPVAIENAKPGTSDWRLTNTGYASGKIEGYPSATSVNRGGTIKLFVSTDDPSYTLEIFRMGWYQGLRGRRMTAPVTLPGIKQTTPAPDPTTGLIECNWVNPYVLTIPNSSDPTDWMSGFYYVKLTSSTGVQQYIHFVVRDDSRTSDLIMAEAITTAQAYNPWGGKSLYGTLANRSDTANAARKVSFDRPFYGDETYGAGNFGENNDFKYYEWATVGFLEANGYDVTYATNIDVDQNPNLLLSHKGFLSVGHDEYWSRNMRLNVEHARDMGVNLGFFSANTGYWQVYFENSVSQGLPARVMVGYKDYCQQDPITPDYLKTCRFRETNVEPINYSEDRMLGVMYITQSRQPFVVEDESSWVLSGTGLHNGDSLIRLGTPDPNNPTKLFPIGYEVDAVGSHSPLGLLRIGHSPATSSHANYSDMTVYRASSGATVFATGSILWNYEIPQFVQITKNVLARFTSGAFSDTTPIRPQLPPPMQATDIGPVGRPGYVALAGMDSFTLNGDGQDSFSGSDALYYAYQPMTGDVTVTTRLTSVQSYWDNRAGIMIRESLSPDAKYVSLVSRPSDSYKGNNPQGVNEGVEFKIKDTTGGSPKKLTAMDLPMPNWLKLSRTGNIFDVYTSSDGTSWIWLSSTTLPMNSTVYVGASVASAQHNVWMTAEYDNFSIVPGGYMPPTDTTKPTVAMTAPANNSTVSGNVTLSASATDDTGVAGMTFKVDGVTIGSEITTGAYSMVWDSRTVVDGVHTLSATARDRANNTASVSVSVTVNNAAPPSTSLPTGWSHQDIGAVGKAGDATYDQTTSAFTIKGAGADIWNSADAFQYAYTSLTGDGQIIARVTQVSTEAAWVKIGVMFRETLDPSSKHGFMLVSNTKGLAFQRRIATAGVSTSTSGGAFTAPRWVRLDRTGSTISAYQSADGTSWTFVGSDTIDMASTIYAGLAVTSHTNAVLATGVVDNVSVTAFNTPPDTDPPTVSISAPLANSTVSGSVIVKVTATDNVGVSSVQLTVDGYLLSGADTTAPYSFALDTTTMSNGSHTIMAIAHDAEGNTGASQDVTVVVNNPPPDTTAPTVSITSPVSGSTVSGTVTISATASDDSGSVAGVQFQLDGVNFGTEKTAAPYSIAWDTMTVGNGSHTLTAVARDAAGNTATSTAVSVNVNNASSGACSSVTLSKTFYYSGAPASTWKVTVTAPTSSCTWTATVDQSWITLNGVSGPTTFTGTGTMTIKVGTLNNTTGAFRYGTVTIGGTSYKVTQEF